MRAQGQLDLDRRDFMRLGVGALAAVAAGGVSLPLFRTARADDEPLAPARKDRIDYRTAKAIPTICFGCTTHCGVIGWVQDGVVRKIEGNPLDINSRGKICSKANGMISYTYYPDRLLHPLKRVGKRGEGKWKRISWDDGQPRGGDAPEDDARERTSGAVRLPLRARQDQGLHEPLLQRLRHAEPGEPTLHLLVEPAGPAHELLRPRVRVGDAGPREHEVHRQLRRATRWRPTRAGCS